MEFEVQGVTISKIYIIVIYQAQKICKHGEANVKCFSTVDIREEIERRLENEGDVRSTHLY